MNKNWELKELVHPCDIFKCKELGVVKLMDRYGSCHGFFCRTHGQEAKERKETEDYFIRLKEHFTSEL